MQPHLTQVLKVSLLRSKVCLCLLTTCGSCSQYFGRAVGARDLVGPQSVEEAAIISDRARPRPSSHEPDRIAALTRTVQFVEPAAPANPPIFLECTLELSPREVLWPQMMALAKEAVRLHDQTSLSDGDASRYEEIKRLWAEVIGLNLAECRASKRIQGALGLEETIHMILKVALRPGAKPIHSCSMEPAVIPC